MHTFNQTKRFGGLTTASYLKEMRKQKGLTVLFTGFFSTRPMIGAWVWTICLLTHDEAKRRLWASQAGSK